jgi:hypothetical protein
VQTDPLQLVLQNFAKYFLMSECLFDVCLLIPSTNWVCLASQTIWCPKAPFGDVAAHQQGISLKSFQTAKMPVAKY